VVFTDFRKAVEQAGVRPPAPLPWCVPAPLAGDLLARISALDLAQPVEAMDVHAHGSEAGEVSGANGLDIRSAFPYGTPAFAGGERAACAHVQQYLARQLPHTYKATRNGLMGVDYSSKWSPWLATGALSPRWAYAQLQQFEAEHGATNSSYWLWFELLWRDYFRLLHLQHSTSMQQLCKLYRYQGLGGHSLASQAPPYDAKTAPSSGNTSNLQQWVQGRTGQPLVDAGMRELAATGYLGNRMRQIVASYWVHDLQGDWRTGAAWFESQLLDYDVYSNQGNWLYISGRGTDPRGGRRFNPMKQTQDHDPEGHYQRLWGTAT
jgi:deoxyribodipyrimidine photo-lyase